MISRLCILLIMLFLAACQTTRQYDSDLVENGKQCGKTRGSFLGSWFDYYERALSFADCSMWVESEQDLRKAISKRGVDKRRAYSLGMHWVTDYFPHRELGVALFYQRKYADSEAEFKISMAQFPSAKAEYYLKRIRKLQVELSNSDQQPPLIKVKSPVQGGAYGSSIVKVEAHIEDDSLLDKVMVNGKVYRHVPHFVTENNVPVRVERKVAKMDLVMEAEAKFKKGKAVIEIVAIDITGKVSKHETFFSIDQQAPQISVSKLVHKVKGNEKQIHLIADIRDKNSDIQQLTINDRVLQVKTEKQRNKQGEWVFWAHIDEIFSNEDSDQLNVIARDQFGHQTEALFQLKERQTKQDKQGELLAVYLKKGREPRITYEKKAYIEGEAKSGSLIRKIEVNGKNILNGRGKQVYFNYMPTLKIGNNEFTLLVEDQAGYKQKIVLAITRKTPPNRSMQERLNVAQFPFPCNQVSRSPCRVSLPLHEMSHELLKNRRRFQIVDGEMIVRLIDETNQCERSVSDNCIIKVADELEQRGVWKQRFANAFFVGTVIERSNEEWDTAVEISGRMVDNNSRETLTSIDVYAENLSVDQGSLLSQALVTEISDAFPLLDREILFINGEGMEIKMGKQDRVWSKMPVLVYRVKDNQSCADAAVTQVSQQKAQARVSRFFCGSLESGVYRVITR